MGELPPDGTFPFGRRVLRRRPSSKSRRRVFVLGAHPTALHQQKATPSSPSRTSALLRGF